MRREALELLPECQRLISRVSQAMKDAGKQLDRGDKKQIKNDCNALQKKVSKLRVDAVTENDLAELRQAKLQLEQSAAKLPGGGV